MIHKLRLLSGGAFFEVMELLSTKTGYRFIADLFMPNRCALCGNVIKWDKLMCKSCENDPPETFGGSLKIENTVCAVGAFFYEDSIIDLIYGLKHGGTVNNFAEYSAVVIAEKLRSRGIADEIDIVTAVPMYRGKKIARGRDQAELLAAYIADKLDKPTEFGALRRLRDKTEQHKLTDKADRQAHAEAVYSSADAGRVEGKVVLICDDVITTGSTIRACAAQLMSMGAKKVYACSAAVSAHYKKFGDAEYIIP